MANLSPKHARFVTEYLKDLNATQAYVRAGYAEKSARVNGPRLLSNAAIAAEIAARQQKALDRAELSATRVLEELRRVAFSDLSNLVDPTTGKLKPLHDIPAEMRASVASVKVTKKNLTTGDGVVDDLIEVKLWDKLKALEGLAKHFGILQDKVEHSGAVSFAWKDSE